MILISLLSDIISVMGLCLHGI